MDVLILCEPQLRSLVSLREAREAVRAAFVALAEGRNSKPNTISIAKRPDVAALDSFIGAKA